MQEGERNGMKNKLGIFCMGLGTVLILAALSLFLWNQQEAKQAENSVKALLPKVVEEIEAKADGTNPSIQSDSSMPEVVVDGEPCIGCLSLPTLQMELPVLSDWSYPRLQIAPCRYSGSVETNDLVIAGHNYEGHFGTLSTLYAGDTLFFTDMAGNMYQYEVQTLEILPADSVKDVTSGEYDLTLFTCNYTGEKRIVVRCFQK